MEGPERPPKPSFRREREIGFTALGAPFFAKYLTAADFKDIFAFYGFHVAIVMTHVLKQCGDDLSRDNILRQALGIKDFTTPLLLLPGITVNTSPTNYLPIRQFQLQRFNGENWELFGDVLSG